MSEGSIYVRREGGLREEGTVIARDKLLDVNPLDIYVH